MKLSFLLILSVFLFVSCGQKKGTSDVSLVLGGLTSTGSINQLGGVILAGKNEDTGQEIRVGLFLDGTENSFTLDRGIWKFAAVGWEGEGGLTNKNFTGQARCAYTGFVDLNAPEVIIPLNLNTPDCNLTLPEGDRFTLSSALDSTLSNTFKVVNFHSCLSIVGPLSGSECNGFNRAGSANIGLTQSYKVMIPGGIEKGLSGNKALPGIDSRCIAIADDSKLRLPLGNGVSSFLDVILLAYAEENCSGVPNIISLKEGAAVNGIIPNKVTYFELSDPANVGDIGLAFEHNEASANVAPIFGNGKDGAKVITASLALGLGDYGEITGLVNDTTFSIAAGDGANIIAEDEIMIYVSKDDSCGGSYGAGKYRFARIKSKSGQNIELFEHFADIMEGGVNPTGVGSTPCQIQIAKVFNYSSYSISTFSHTPLAYDDARGVGGILAMRVNGLMNMGDAGYFSADATGPLGTLSSTNICDHTIEPNCHPLGSGNGGYRAGGFVFLAAKDLQSSAGATSASITSNGDALGPSDNGQIFVQSKNVNISGVVNLEVQTIGGNAGSVDFFYCSLSETTGILNITSANSNEVQSSALCL